MTTIIHAAVGSVSHGTLLTEDLLDAFAGELELLVNRNAKAWRSDEGGKRRDKYMKLVGDAREVDDKEDAAEIIIDLMDALQEFAPQGVFFGAHEGDGSDFGFWPNEEESPQ